MKTLPWIHLAGIGLAWVGLALAACNDSPDPVEGDSSFGRLNGQPCLLISGESPCRGGVCLPFTEGGRQGVCSEPCQDVCRYGGECLRYVHPALDLDRVCLKACEGLENCDDPLVCFGIDSAFECDGRTCDDEASDRTWCRTSF